MRRAGPAVNHLLDEQAAAARHGAPTFVTLNPQHAPREETVISREIYEHPVFNPATDRAQQEIWSLQGVRNTWFCGAHFGSGFHEDGIQAGWPSPKISAVCAGPAGRTGKRPDRSQTARETS